MKSEHVVFVLAIVLGLLLALVDACLDYFFFYEGTFWELLLFDVPPHEVYMRTLVVTCFVVFGAVVSRIIADRRRTETTLQEREATLKSIFRAAPTGIGLVSNRTLLQVNERVCEMIGYSRDELVGNSSRMLYPSQEEFEFVGQRKYAQIRERGTGTVETRMQHKDGRILDILLSSTPIDPDDPASGVTFTALDITERNRTEQKLRRMAAQLNHVSRLTTMGEMVAGIAHEVNQPLYSILNFAKAITNTINGGKDVDPEQIRTWTGNIETAAVRAGEIIRRVRNFVARSDPQRTPCNIHEIIEESVELIASEAQGRHVNVGVQSARQAPDVAVDRVEIQQVVVNLLRNAYEALESQSDAARRVLVQCVASDAVIDVSVSDNGPGLPRDDKMDILAPFVTSKPDGLGMGLAVSKTIVEGHGGELWASSNVDGGATFHFTLPLRKYP